MSVDEDWYMRTLENERESHRKTRAARDTRIAELEQRVAKLESRRKNTLAQLRNANKGLRNQDAALKKVYRAFCDAHTRDKNRLTAAEEENERLRAALQSFVNLKDLIVPPPNHMIINIDHLREVQALQSAIDRAISCISSKEGK